MYRFALIGCGSVSGMHLQQLEKRGRLSAVCDINRERADALASQYKVPACYTIDELLSLTDAEVVVICTPNGYHAEHAIKSLQAGKHVICESPLCLTSAAAWQMIETEKFCRKKMMVVHASLFKSTAQLIEKARSTAQQGTFELMLSASGSAIENNWRQSAFPGGGLLYSYFVQDIDLLLTLFGDIDEVKRFSENGLHKQTTEVELKGAVQLKMRDGLSGKLAWNMVNDPEHNFLKLETEARPIRLQELEEKRKPSAEDYDQMYSYFIDTLQNDQPSNLHQAMKTVTAIEKIYKAFTPNPSTTN